MSGQRTIEFIAYAYPLSDAFGADWPCAPGGAVRAIDGSASIFHFAPGHWLIPQLTPAIEAQLAAASRAGAGAAFTVDGQWQAIELAPPQALALAATLDVPALLAGRECAAVMLFDCPAVVARTTSYASDDQGYTVWVRASYAQALRDGLRHAQRPR